MKHLKKFNAFSLAEVIIAIAVIGIVAALTLPSLQAYIQDMAIKVKKKALHTRTAQALHTIPLLTDYGNAYDFIDKGYRERYKIERLCGTGSLPVLACNLPANILRPDGMPVKMPTKWSELNSALVNISFEDDNHDVYEYSAADSNSAAFITDNGESINLFYNPKCKNPEENSNKGFYVGRYTCINMIFDINGGDKPPNEIGKDIGFITVFGNSEPLVVAPVITIEDLGPASFETARSLCKIRGGANRAPSQYELASMFVNAKLFGMGNDGLYWSGMPATMNKAYTVHAKAGYIDETDVETNLPIRCIAK